MGIDLLSVMSGLSGAGQGILAAQDRKVALDRQAKMDAMAQAELQTKQANFNKELELKNRALFSEEQYREGVLNNHAAKLGAAADIQNRKLEIESNKVANKTYMSKLGLSHAYDKTQLENLKKSIKDAEESLKTVADAKKQRELNSQLEEDTAKMKQLEAKVQEGELTLKAFDTAYMSKPEASPLEFSLSASNYLKDVQVGNSMAIVNGVGSNDPNARKNVTAKLINENKGGTPKPPEDGKPAVVPEQKKISFDSEGLKNAIDSLVASKDLSGNKVKQQIYMSALDKMSPNIRSKVSSLPAKDAMVPAEQALNDLIAKKKISSGNMSYWSESESISRIPGEDAMSKSWDAVKDFFRGY